MGDAIDAFLTGDRFAVVGASRDRSKYGNKVLRSYWQAGREAHPVNPHATAVEGVEGHRCYPDLATLHAELPVHGVSIITQPVVSEDIVEQAATLGIRHLWMQPGAESEGAIRRAEALGLNLIHSGPCILVVQGFRDSPS